MADEDERAIIAHYFQRKLIQSLGVVTAFVLGIGLLSLLAPGMVR